MFSMKNRKNGRSGAYCIVPKEENSRIQQIKKKIRVAEQDGKPVSKAPPINSGMVSLKR